MQVLMILTVVASFIMIMYGVYVSDPMWVIAGALLLQVICKLIQIIVMYFLQKEG
jgi:hypothetical protein